MLKANIRSFYRPEHNDVVFIVDNMDNIRVNGIQYNENEDRFYFNMDDGVNVAFPREKQQMTPQQIAGAKQIFITKLLPSAYTIDIPP